MPARSFRRLLGVSSSVYVVRDRIGHAEFEGNHAPC
jgi:hypothetical protein